MKMIFWGYNSFGEIVLKYFLDKGYIIPLIVTPSSSPEKINSLRKIIGEETLIMPITEYSENEIKSRIVDISPDVMLSCSFKYKIPRSLLEIQGKRIINIHGAILPEFRGANMLNWAIIKGCTKTGVTLHYMNETLDTGDILAEITYPIYKKDDANSVKKRMYNKTIQLFDKSWEKIVQGKTKPKKQDAKNGFYYPGRKPEDGKINWHLNAVEIKDLIRALVFPFPGAYTFYMGEKMIIEKVDIIYDQKVHFKPGKIIKVTNSYIEVTTLYNKLRIFHIRKGTKEMINLDFSIFELNTYFTND